MVHPGEIGANLTTGHLLANVEGQEWALYGWKAIQSTENRA